MTCNGTGNSNDFSSVMSTKELAECISTTDVCIFQTNFSSLPLEDQQILSEAKCIKEHAYYDVYGVSCMLVLLCVVVVDNWGICESCMGYA